jgi:hypothetical protein
MGPIERALFTEFRESAVMRGDMLLFHQQDAINYVRRSFDLKALILGIDVFEPIGEWIRTEDYVDYSAKDFHLREPDVWKEAEGFLRRHSQEGLLFEVVIDEPRAPQDGSKT